jgi:Zn/Cd-binding protein ZinT
MSDDDDEITEEMVEGIYAEHQHKIETISGYAEAFQRLYELMHKVMLGEQVDPKAINEAMLELFLATMVG